MLDERAPSSSAYGDVRRADDPRVEEAGGTGQAARERVQGDWQLGAPGQVREGERPAQEGYRLLQLLVSLGTAKRRWCHVNPSSRVKIANPTQIQQL